ncbi:MAG: uroporphyrinogen-III synthase [bacterium]|nr:uroporphyrinogen-III synthase [bacterium]
MRIAVTRDEQNLVQLKQRAALSDIDIVPLPFLRTEPLDFELPKEVLLDQSSWLVFTSSQAVRLFFERLRKNSATLPYGVKIAVVGSKTAALVCEQGKTVDMIPTTAGSKGLFEELLKDHIQAHDTIVYARADRVSFDPELLLSNANVKYYPLICYRTIVERLDSEETEKLTPSDFILFTSPSTVRAYSDQFGLPIAKPIALGRSTAEQMSQLGWELFNEMKTANVNLVLENL